MDRLEDPMKVVILKIQRMFANILDETKIEYDVTIQGKKPYIYK